MRGKSGRPRSVRSAWLTLMTLLVLTVGAAARAEGQQVTLVDMIPNSLSGETNRDAEPNLSVNPANPAQVVGSAFTPDPLGSANLPLFVSTDRGVTWTLSAAIVPGTSGSCFTAICDITLRFAASSNLLYVSDLNPIGGVSQLDIWRVTNPTTVATTTALQSRPGSGGNFADQPYIEAGTSGGSDRVFVGDNDLMAAGGQTATIDHSTTTTPPPPSGFTNTVLETRATTGQDSPSVRPAVHRDGTVYAIYAAFRAGGTQVVVVRDDNWGTGATPFRALMDSDVQPGIRVASSLTNPGSIGSQRAGQGLAIAVDPSNSSVVYIVFGDGSTQATYTLHVRRSTDRGVSWSGDLFTVAAATNPGIAVSTAGEVGFMYQQINGSRFETHLVRSSNAFASTTDLLLANVPDSAGSYTGSNPIGDYASLQSVGTDFYGIFSANNTPDPANFLPGVVFQRNHDFTAHTLSDLSNNAVAVSIDPFFFHVAYDPQIQIPGPIVFPPTCLGSSSAATANICNTGKKDLLVQRITSSNPQFTVTTPSSGYPVTVAPGSCFPFQVVFTPTSTGLQSGTLTVPSNDPLTPSASIAVSGTGTGPVIATMVVDTGNFGEVCEGTFKDKVVTIANSGACPLRITSITSSSPEFQVPQVLSFPLVIAPGTSIEVPIRLEPTSPGPKTTTLTIANDDPSAPAKQVTLTGRTPQPWTCHPPTFASLSMSAGPTFGDTRTGDFTFTGQGRAMLPFGPHHSFGVQTQGEFLAYHERYEGEFASGVLSRWKWIQGGVFANIKAVEFRALGNDGGVLGQASFTLDVLLKKFRVNVFGTKGFHDDPVTVRVVDQFGGGAQVSLAPFAPKTYLEGNLVFLHPPEPASDRPAAMLRVSHQLFERLELTAEISVNESLVGPTNDGRLVFGFVFGRWARPVDLSNRGTPLGTDLPRVHYVLVK